MRTATATVTRRAVALAMVSSIVGMTLPGCPTSCTAIGWFEGLTIRLDKATFGNSAYLIEVMAEGLTVMVDFSVANGKTSCDYCQVVAKRPDGSGLTALLTGVTWRGDAGVRFASLQIYRTDSEHRIAGGPATVTVTIHRDGLEVATRTFTPQYRRDEINGPGCGVATRAEEEWDVQP